MITHNVEVGSKKGFDDAHRARSTRCSRRRCRAGTSSRSKIDGVDGLRRADARRDGAIAERRAAVREPGRRQLEGREQRRARPQAQGAEDAGAEGHDGHRAQRQRRRGLGRERELPARPARLHHAAAAGQRASRTRRPRTTSTPQIYFDPSQKDAKAAALALKKLVEPADVKPLPKDPALRALDPGAMLLFVTGPDVPQHDRRRRRRVEAPKQQPPNVRYDARPGRELVEQYRGQVPFKLMVPTVLERSSVPRPGLRRHALAALQDRQATTRRSGSSSAPAPTSTGASRRPTGTTRPCSPTAASGTGSRAATTTSTTRASTCTWSCCAQGDATYWVVNTLLDSLSNETMLAIAKGLKPLGPAK